MIMDVDNLHASFARMNGAAVPAFALTLVAIKLLEHRREILNDALQLQFCAMNQLMAIWAIPLERIQ